MSYNFFTSLKRVLAALCLIAGLQTIASAQIAPELLRNDLQVLQDSLVKLHPGLYRYRSKKEIDQLFQKAGSAISGPMSPITFYTLIRQVISGIEDGHTSAFLPPDVNKTVISQAKLFPLWLYFIGDEAYITADACGLPAGTTINKVDGQSVVKLRKELFLYIPSDGADQSGKSAEMNAGESPFLYLYYLVYGEKTSFKVNYTRPNGVTADTVLQARQFKDIVGKPTQQKITQYLKLTYTPDGIAILTVKTFLNGFLDDTHENFRTFIQSAFHELAEKHIKSLIIDVRNNAGGHDDNGMFLDSYLANHPFYYTASIHSTTKEFTAADNTDLLIQQPAADHFNGKVFILMNGKSFSTTADFCAVAQNTSAAKFIGEETGGGYYGNTSGARTTLLLPNTKIRVNVPLWAYFDAVKPAKYKDRGVIPDYLIVPTISDVIEQRDVQLNFALKIAGQ